MGNLDSEYPTDQQVEESFKAYKKDGEKGVLEFLKEQRRKREAVEAAKDIRKGE
jgi:hypothetical protein